MFDICLSALPRHCYALHASFHGNPSKLSTMLAQQCLIHKSQKHPFKIDEQSVLQQPVISVTVGQWRHGVIKRKTLPPFN